MIQAIFFENANREFTSFVITGHANFDVEGSDIVCSAVSAISIGTVNNLERLVGIDTEVTVDEVDDGLLAAALDEENFSNPSAQLLLQNMYWTLVDIASEFPKYLEIRIQE